MFAKTDLGRQSAVIGRRERLSPASAAFVTSAGMHGLDLDDGHTRAVTTGESAEPQPPPRKSGNDRGRGPLQALLTRALPVPAPSWNRRFGLTGISTPSTDLTPARTTSCFSV